MGLFIKKDKKEAEPQWYMSATNNAVLNYNVYKFNAKERILFFILTFVVGGLVGLIFYGGLFRVDGEATFATFISNIVVFGGVGLLASKMFMPIIRDWLKKRRLGKLKTQFRDFLDSLSNSLSGGMNVNDALVNAYGDLESQYSENAYIVTEVREMISGTQNNIPLEDMLVDFGNRSGNDDIKNFAIVFETAYRTGGNIKEIIRRTTDIISEKIMIAEEIQTKITSNKMQMQVMNVIPIFLVLMLRGASSEFDEAFSSIVGVICMTIGVCFFLAAYKIGQKMMDIKG